MSLPMRKLLRSKGGKPYRREHHRRMRLELLECRRLLAGPAVESVDPLANSYIAPPDTDVSVTYDQAIDPASVSAATFAVHSMQSGKLLQPPNTLSVSGSTITLDPAAEFKPGELVEATATTGIRNTNGEAAEAPFVWQFRTEVTGGSGTFLDSGQSLTSTPSVALGDLDGDADLDAFLGDAVWLNDGQGHFSDSGQLLDRDLGSASLGDLDGDGDLDAFVAIGLLDISQPNKVWLNDGQGNFSNSGQSLGNSVSNAVALGDVDGDGDLDAFVANGYVNAEPNKVWLNDGQGRFSDSGQSLGNYGSANVALGDVDGDGDLDAFVTNTVFQGPRVPNKVWLNDGQGHFSDSGQSLGSSLGEDVDLEDLDGDGDLDAFVTNIDDPDMVWLNDGQGHFSDSGQRLGGNGSTYALALGDVDGDGDLDAFRGYIIDTTVWLNDGQGRFSDSGQFLDNGCGCVGLGDLDGDGDLDAVLARLLWHHPVPSPNMVYLNQNPQADLAIAKTDGQVVAMPGGPLSYTVTVTNNGPAGVTGATVTDLFPWQLTGVTWTATASPGSICTPSGTGDIHDTVDLLAGGTITYTATGTVDPAATGTPTNQASVSVPAGYEDPAPENNTASDTDTLISQPITGGTGIFADSGQSLGDLIAGGMALGDLDGDGDLDAFVASYGPGQVWLGDGQGLFTDSGQNLGDMRARAVALGDLDGDGDLDACIASPIDYDKVEWGNRVWLNDGQGHFTDTGQFLASFNSQDVALGDLDGDGDLDAFFATQGEEGSAPNTVWLNNGQGTFSDSGQRLGRRVSEAVELGDLDGDGDLDAFVANSTDMTPDKVWLNDGQGHFTDSGQNIGRSRGYAVALGDLDGDGDLDAFVGNGLGIDGHADKVWLNDGQGTFSDSGQHLGDTMSGAVALGDFDGDGDLDAFVTEQDWGDDGYSTVWLNDGQGTFSDSGQHVGDMISGAVVLGDVDADGDLDALVGSLRPGERNKLWLNQEPPKIISVDPAANTHTAPPDTDVSATYDQDIDPASVSDGTFAVHAMQSGQLLEPQNVFSVDGSTIRLNPAADFNPGELVRATATTGIENLSGQAPTNPYVWQFRTEVTGGTGVFLDSGQGLGAAWSRTAVLADLDGDGDLDAFVANVDGPNTVWLNDGQGTFSDSGQRLGSGASEGLALGDLDGDGDVDAFVGNCLDGPDPANRVWLNDGQGTFSDSGQSLGASPTAAVALGDLDGDGDLDAFVGNGLYGTSAPNKVWLNDGQGQFTDSGQSLGNSETRDIGLGDLDGDGDLDAFFANYTDSPNQVWLNDGQGHFTDSGQRLGPPDAKHVALADLDGDGDLDAFVANLDNSDMVWLNDGQGRFTDSGQRLAGQASTYALAVGDVDGDGDLDAFVEYALWLNDGQGRFNNSGQSFDNWACVGIALADVDGDRDLDAFMARFSLNPNQVWLNQDPQADLAIAKTDGQVVAMPGGPLSYTVTVTNNGPAGVTGATVTDLFPWQLTDVTWAGTASPGSICTPSGTGDIHDTVDLLAGGTITYTATATVHPAATGTPTNQATVATPPGYDDPAPENNTASDTDTLILPASGGTGVYTDSGQSLGNRMSCAMALGDLDGDADLDAFVGNLGAPNTVWLGDGQGHFTDSGQNLGGSESVAVALGDLDGDGDLDAFVGNSRYGGAPNKVWLNDGNGHFSDSGQSLGASASPGVALGDLDGDGDLDAFVGNLGGPNKVWINDGQGTFSNSGQSLGSLQSADVALGDLDGDGDLDAFVGNSTGRQPNKVWLNDGEGLFSDSGQNLGGSLSMGVALGDLDSDGDLDVFVANSDDPNTVWINNGQGTFSDSGQRLGGEASSFAVALGDLDDDGDLDAFVGNWSHGPNQVWLNDGQGHFSDSGQRLVGGNTESVALGDVDADGDLDACTANFYDFEPNKVWLNQNAPEVVARHVFYNNSVFDGYDPAANPDDDDAIAPGPEDCSVPEWGKTALLCGQTATFQNYTSYSRGINGIMVDVVDLPPAEDPPNADDYFELKVGNDNDLAQWSDAPDPVSVTVRPGDGVHDSDRITIVWQDNVIQKQWLQVTVLANDNTGLGQPDVFYFGNAIGDSGNSATDAKVNAYDMLGARDNQRTFINPAPICFPYDFNRDARVNAYDMLIARDNQTHFLNALKLITVPDCKGQTSPVLAGMAAEATTTAVQIAGQDELGAQEPAAQEKQYEPNQPVGDAKGLHPGRVTWVHDPEATSWDGSSNYWWDNNNTSQAVVGDMLSKAVRWQAGQRDDPAAWDAIFRHFNQTHHEQDAGYARGEKVAIKVNLNTVSGHGDRDNTVDMSPQVVLALVRQLVRQVGMLPGDITIFDASRYIPDRLYDPIHAEFSDVLFVDRIGGNGRIRVQPDTTPENLVRLSAGSRETLRLPICVTQAKYLINVANLKKHDLAGMTMTAKNCFGAIMQFRNNQWEWSPSNLHPYVEGNDPMDRYDGLVDLVGHRHLGGKTLLYMIDGLYGAMGQSSTPRRWTTFGNDWTSSLFLSQDPMAIDSVALDFLRAETSVMQSTESYLHEGASVENPPSGTTYDPHNDGTPLESLGVHEHWNNATSKQYTRNLQTGDGIQLVAEEPIPPAAVCARHIFYNNSAFDGNDPAPHAEDDHAIAPDKLAGLPGGPITFASYTSYSRGINGIMVDVENLPQGVTLEADDFRFRMGNSTDLDTWTTAPDPESITIRPGEGTDGSDRVTLIWSDNALQKQWLQVTVLANADTALSEPDVFYFGNAVGESGNSTLDAKVDAYDMLGARDNQRTFVNPARIDFPYDYNRDGRVNAYDMLIARDNQTHFLNALNLRLTHVTTHLVGEGALLSYRVPTSGDAGLGTAWTATGFDDSRWVGGNQSPRVLITEAGTADLDYVEIQNVSQDTVDTSGWIMAVNDAYDVGHPPNINAVHSERWSLPASMPTGEVLYRKDTDDAAGNYWGENIFWRTDGPGWIVLLDGQGTVADFVVWGYSEAEIASMVLRFDGHHVTSEGIWHGEAVARNVDDDHSLQRVSNLERDGASDWDRVSPRSMGTPNTDLSIPVSPGITSGIGFSTNPDNFGDAVRTEIEAEMCDRNASLWIRIPFEVYDPSGLDELQLRIKYNDGFVAYLNGDPIARRNAPDSPAWDSAAPDSRAYDDSSEFEEIDVTGFLGALQWGTNVLAIHGLNDGAADGDFVVLPELIGTGNLALLPGQDVPKTHVDRVPAHDAVWERTLGRESGDLATCLAKFEWLHEFESTDTYRQPRRDGPPIPQAVDKLLARWWP